MLPTNSQYLTTNCVSLMQSRVSQFVTLLECLETATASAVPTVEADGKNQELHLPIVFFISIMISHTIRLCR